MHNHAPGKSLVGPIYLNRGRRTFYMQCGFHAYMESWAMAVNNPYYALTDSNGKFTIENIPPGTYQLVVWHPQTGPGVTKMVTIQPDGKLVEQLSLLAPKGNRSAFTGDGQSPLRPGHPGVLSRHPASRRASALSAHVHYPG